MIWDFIFYKISDEMFSADDSEIPDFICKLKKKILKIDLTPDQVYNTDENK